MEIKELKKKIVGRKLMNIIQLEPTQEIVNAVKVITNSGHDDIDDLQLLVFEDNVELLYTDYDCDGYRSGDWYLSILRDVLDKGATKELKVINSTVRDLVYIEQNENDGKNFFLLSTDDYIITFGQDNVHDYYPSNFFNVEECKAKAIEDRKIPKGENINKEP